MAWNAEAERKHGNVAFLTLSTWLWLLVLGWVSIDAPPLDGVQGVGGLCWLLQFGTFGLFEARSLLRNVRRGGSTNTKASRVQRALASGIVQVGYAPARVLLGPHLGRVEPPLWSGRIAMLMLCALGLYTDTVHSGGAIHEFLQPGPLTGLQSGTAAAGGTLAGISEVRTESIPSLVADATMVGAFPL